MCFEALFEQHVSEERLDAIPERPRFWKLWRQIETLLLLLLLLLLLVVVVVGDLFFLQINESACLYFFHFGTEQGRASLKVTLYVVRHLGNKDD